jgi:membrane associated rhomboid family serine protease
MRPPESWKRAPATIAIAAITALASLAVIASGHLMEMALWAGFIPGRVQGAGEGMQLMPLALTPLTATLIHAGLVHLFFNLLIHLFCGRSVESIVGTPGLVVLYLVGAYAAAGAQYLAGMHEVEPMVGASGAISAIIGAYAMLFGRNRVKAGSAAVATLINAAWLVAAWVVLQYLIGFLFLSMGLQVAIAAHVGGFLAGLALAKPLLLWRWRGA